MTGTDPGRGRARWRRAVVPVLGLVLVAVGAAVALGVADDGDDDRPPATTTTSSVTVSTTVTPSTELGSAGRPAPPGAAAAGADLRDVPYCELGGVELALDFFHAHVGDVTPLVVFVHGGGWRRGDKAQVQRLPEFDLLRAAGYSIASVDYRLAPDHVFPAPIEDVKCAIRHLRANAAAYGIDPDRIGIAGFSAGAHLATLAGVADESAGFDVGPYPGVSSAVRAVVEADGPIDIDELRTSQPEVARDTFEDSAELMVAASPLTYLDPADPPVLIFHGELDRTVSVEHAHQLDEALAAVGVEHVLVVVPGGDHSWPTSGSSRRGSGESPYSATVLEFLDRHLR